VAGSRLRARAAARPRRRSLHAARARRSSWDNARAPARRPRALEDEGRRRMLGLADRQVDRTSAGFGVTSANHCRSRSTGTAEGATDGDSMVARTGERKAGLYGSGRAPSGATGPAHRRFPVAHECGRHAHPCGGGIRTSSRHVVALAHRRGAGHARRRGPARAGRGLLGLAMARPVAAAPVATAPGGPSAEAIIAAAPFGRAGPGTDPRRLPVRPPPPAARCRPTRACSACLPGATAMAMRCCACPTAARCW